MFAFSFEFLFCFEGCCKSDAVDIINLTNVLFVCVGTQSLSPSDFYFNYKKSRKNRH